MASPASASIADKILPHCWVCNQRFNDQVPPGPACEERHHLIPQAYGGQSGPQVSLCDKHHSVVHRISTAIKAGKPWQPFVAYEPPDRKKKLIWMAGLVVKAEQATVNDVHKPTKVVLVLDARQKQQLEHCQRVLGFTNRAEVYHEALALLFKSTLKSR